MTASPSSSTAKEKDPSHPCACRSMILSKDSHPLCITCLGVRHAQAAVANPECCLHCSQFLLMVLQHRARVAAVNKGDQSLCSTPLHSAGVLFPPSSKEASGYDSSKAFKRKRLSCWSVGTSSSSAPHVVSLLSTRGVMQDGGRKFTQMFSFKRNKNVFCASRQWAKGTDVCENTKKIHKKTSKSELQPPALPLDGATTSTLSILKKGEVSVPFWICGTSTNTSESKSSKCLQ